MIFSNSGYKVEIDVVVPSRHFQTSRNFDIAQKRTWSIPGPMPIVTDKKETMILPVFSILHNLVRVKRLACVSKLSSYRSLSRGSQSQERNTSPWMMHGCTRGEIRETVNRQVGLRVSTDICSVTAIFYQVLSTDQHYRIIMNSFVTRAMA